MIIDRFIQSPHKSKRDYPVVAIVIHIMEGSLSGTGEWFSNPISKVSAHYGIGKEGTVHQYVAEDEAAWHAGKVVRPTARLVKERFPGINPNQYTIGIEHEGYANRPWTITMLNKSIALTADICKRYSIEPNRENIIAHREIRADKSCPGFLLNLNTYVADVARAMEMSIEQRINALERRIAILERQFILK